MMNFGNNKKVRQVIVGIVVAVLVIAMILPMALSVMQF